MMKNMILAGAAAFMAAVIPASAALASPAHHRAPRPQNFYLELSKDADSGFCGNWAQDDLFRTFTVRALGGGQYAVSTTDVGTWHAIPGAVAPLSSPCDPAAVMGSHESGPMYGADTFTVAASGPASERNLETALAGDFLHGGYGFVPVLDGSKNIPFSETVLALFPPGAAFTATGDFTTWSDTYYFFRAGHREVQVQSYLGYSDTPVGIFTNGG